VSRDLRAGHVRELSLPRAYPFRVRTDPLPGLVRAVGRVGSVISHTQSVRFQGSGPRRLRTGVTSKGGEDVPKKPKKEEGKVEIKKGKEKER
jgi:hypothetical protein